MVRVPEKMTSPYPDKAPSDSLENELARHVLSQVFESVVTVAITLHGKLFAGALDNKVDPVVAGAPLRYHPVSTAHEALQDLRFKIPGAGVDTLHGLLQEPHERRRVLGVLDETAAEVARLEIIDRVERMDHPQLVSCAASSYIESFLEHSARPILAEA